jgi:hypothetical protein
MDTAKNTFQRISKKALGFLSSEWGRYAIPVFLLGAYVALERYPFSSLIGLSVFLSIACILAADFVPSKGAAQPAHAAAKDIVFSLAAAIGLWLLLSFALNTSKPLNVVTSCSMLPVLHRGDLVFLQGGDFAAPLANLSSPLATGDLRQGTCTKNYFSGNSEQMPCTLALDIDGREYPATDPANSILVFEPEPAYYGLIIHRAVAKINFRGQTVVLTKGDNNNIIDQNGGMHAVSQDRIQGKVVFVVPWAGYVKIFLFGGFEFLSRLLAGDVGYAFSAFEAPPGCDFELFRPPNR